MLWKAVQFTGECFYGSEIEKNISRIVVVNRQTISILNYLVIGYLIAHFGLKAMLFLLLRIIVYSLMEP